MASLNSIKQLRKFQLKRSAHHFLVKRYDWKVIRAQSTDTELTEGETAFRSSIVDEYDKRVAAVNAAETVTDVLRVRVRF